MTDVPGSALSEAPAPAAEPASSAGTKVAATVAIWVNLVVLLGFRGAFGRVATSPVLQDWATVFVSITLQALPFLVLGVTLSGLLSSVVPARWLARAIPTRTALAVPAAGLAGAVLPGCECSAVPVARRFIGRGVPAAAALTFLLAAPAINPVVLVATAAAFPDDPRMVVARLVASLLVAVAVGGLWARFGDSRALEGRLRQATEHDHRFVDVVVDDFLQAGGFLVLGAALVASIQTFVPTEVLDRLGGSGVVAILAMAALAILLSVCSEADAFVAAGLPQFSLTARLVFLVVGPMVDLKLIAMQAGTFGRGFALRFAPLTLAVAIPVAALVGWLVLA